VEGLRGRRQLDCLYHDCCVRPRQDGLSRSRFKNEEYKHMNLLTLNPPLCDLLVLVYAVAIPCSYIFYKYVASRVLLK
jgi:hypothetical protein